MMNLVYTALDDCIVSMSQVLNCSANELLHAWDHTFIRYDLLDESMVVSVVQLKWGVSTRSIDARVYCELYHQEPLYPVSLIWLHHHTQYLTDHLYCALKCTICLGVKSC